MVCFFLFPAKEMIRRKSLRICFFFCSKTDRKKLPFTKNGAERSAGGSNARLYVAITRPNCIEHSTWPSAWKMGEWTPVFKKGDQHDARNYRPITSPIAVDKIFELLSSNQVTSHYDETLYYRMAAYRKRNSCETTLLMLIEDWKRAVDSKQLVSVLSTDMSKAFDSLSHSLCKEIGGLWIRRAIT